MQNVKSLTARNNNFTDSEVKRSMYREVRVPFLVFSVSSRLYKWYVEIVVPKISTDPGHPERPRTLTYERLATRLNPYEYNKN